jgi:hypothetical protein
MAKRQITSKLLSLMKIRQNVNVFHSLLQMRNMMCPTEEYVAFHHENSTC